MFKKLKEWIKNHISGIKNRKKNKVMLDKLFKEAMKPLDLERFMKL